MLSEVRVVADNGQSFTFHLESGQALSNADARQWLDSEFVRLDGEPLRASGKLLTADKVLAVVRAAGPGLLADANWGQKLAAAVVGALGKSSVTIDVSSLTVSF